MEPCDTQSMTTEVVSTYDQRTVVVKVTGADPIPLDDGPLAVDRATIVYRRAQAEPWEFGMVRLVGTIHGERDDAILVYDESWPMWLQQAVRDNWPASEPDASNTGLAAMMCRLLADKDLTRKMATGGDW